MSSDLRSRTIRLAHARPTLRPALLPLLKKASYVLSFTLSTGLEHDEDDAEREGGEYTKALNDCLQEIEDALDGYSSAGYKLKVKFTTSKKGTLVVRLETSNTLPFTRETLERVVGTAEKELLKQIDHLASSSPLGEWVFGRGPWLIEENVF